jgi:hypothetical protein
VCKGAFEPLFNQKRGARVDRAVGVHLRSPFPRGPDDDPLRSPDQLRVVRNEPRRRRQRRGDGEQDDEESGDRDARQSFLRDQLRIDATRNVRNLFWHARKPLQAFPREPLNKSGGRRAWRLRLECEARGGGDAVFIVDDEQRSSRAATAMRPSGYGRRSHVCVAGAPQR